MPHRKPNQHQTYSAPVLQLQSTKELLEQFVLMLPALPTSKLTLSLCRKQDAKNSCKQQLIDSGMAYKYAEPEKEVLSRSGNECVVALTDQWYVKYGEEAWRGQVCIFDEKCVWCSLSPPGYCVC